MYIYIYIYIYYPYTNPFPFQEAVLKTELEGVVQQHNARFNAMLAEQMVEQDKLSAQLLTLNTEHLNAKNAAAAEARRALLSVCGRCSFGVLFSSCACVCVSLSGVLFSVGVCVCVCVTC